MEFSLTGSPATTPLATPGGSRQKEQRFRPAVAPSPYSEYQQAGSEASYFPVQPQQQAQPPQQQPQTMDGLSNQMGTMGLGAQAPPAAAPSARPHKKKDRHAYHQLETPAAAQPLPGAVPGTTSSQFYNAQNAPMPGTAAPYMSQQITPAMSQFPAATSAFAPANPVTSMEHAARQGDQLLSAPASSQSGRVDPDQIPSVPRSRDIPARHYQERIYPTMEQHLPPPAAVPFVAFDQGNSSPKFARLTLNNIPTSNEALRTTGLPLGLVLQPLAPLQDGEQPVPVLDFGDVGPPRCRRCRTYINPFMTFRSGGNKFICNLCTHPNDVPSEYFAPTDPTGIRVDRSQRPELMLGTVDFLVPKEYWTRDPVPLQWLFVIDVSLEASSRGFLEAMCKGILHAIYAEDGSSNVPAGVKVGIVTFDREVHFYNLTAGLEQAQMIVMPDIEDPFVPLSQGLFVDPQQSKTAITSLLSRIPDMFSSVKSPEPALLPAINAALAALTATGGKIICSVSSLPTFGPGRLFPRDKNEGRDTDAEKKLYTTEHPGWRGTAAKMVEAGVGIDFFMAAPSGGYLDIATIGHCCAVSGGETYYYPNFHSPRDDLRLAKELKHTVTRETGFQALMKVRCSNGLQLSAYHGNFTQHTFGADLEFGSIDADKAITVMFSYDGKLDPKLDAHFQSALLYTTATGERRVRCTNTVASVSESALEAMKFVDQDAVVSVISKEAASRVSEKTLTDIRNSLSEKTIDILAGYRKNFSGSHPPGQLVLPENLKELGMYMLGLIKSRAFKGGREPSDRRIHDMRLIRSMGPMELSLYLYPRIIAIHNMEQTDGFADENGRLMMPSTIRASFGQIEEGGAYIVDNGQICLLWLHSQVSPNLLEDLFGEGYNELKHLDPFSSSLPVLETHLNAQVRNIMQYMEITRGSKAMTIQLARQGLDGAEYEFARLLYEDRNGEAQSYVDWLVHVHRQIQMELSGQRKKDEGGVDISNTVASTFAGLRTPYWG
ncbi:Sec23/Sec24 family protein [Aureobasidium pullulans EXF-150]|uniref:Sec23/Sec24 family protein n=1 Tax=Aureobasidium pullulans EXF-150 TaxID=1043002 RepID=A0A074Y707_AURPU|nr:Sec23/Sec24 family protein [Aureobasidium pullulans EXF-150]KEQ90017.1 Sec23/Sec24 family protein [Aureobasidium pullulans EXF-150]THY93519.1 Sec23/Sec24 family protein [Aureobasidium pullulans]